MPPRSGSSQTRFDSLERELAEQEERFARRGGDPVRVAAAGVEHLAVRAFGCSAASWMSSSLSSNGLSFSSCFFSSAVSGFEMGVGCMGSLSFQCRSSELVEVLLNPFGILGFEQRELQKNARLGRRELAEATVPYWSSFTSLFRRTSRQAAACRERPRRPASRRPTRRRPPPASCFRRRRLR